MQQRTGVVFRAIVFSLTALMIGFAFAHSLMSAADSTVESEGALGFLNDFFTASGYRSK